MMIGRKLAALEAAEISIRRKQSFGGEIKKSLADLKFEQRRSDFHLKTTIFYFKFITKTKGKGYDPVIGIDLGTTSSYVGIFKNGLVEIIPDDQGNRSTPSYVAFTPEGERLIGDAAKNQLTSNPENTLFDVTRLIGREFNDPSVQQDIKHFPFKVIEKNSKPIIQINTGKEQKLFTPEEILAMILEKMREIAEAYLGKKVIHAVVTVPAYSNDAQRQATKDAGTISGLNVLRIINEPTAAAIAYGLDKQEDEKKIKKRILVFDLGGGTFAVSIVIVSDGVFKVIATNGDTHLGGEDFNQRVMDYFIELFKKKTGQDVRKDNRAVQKLRCEVEKAKRTLSSQHQTNIEIKSFIDNKDFNEILTRAKFEELNMDLFQSTMNTLEKVLTDAKFWKTDIDEIVLVGGSTRIPKIQQSIKEFLAGKEPSPGINPDEAVVHGAARQACFLSSEKDGGIIILFEANPSTIGIKTVSGAMREIIPRNTAIPTKKSHRFTTAADNQPTGTLQVFEGERVMAKDNRILGIFDLIGIPLAPHGVSQIEVTFQIDVNGILIMTAEDKGIGNKNNIIISSNTNRLLPKEIDFMIKELENIVEKEKKVKERIDAEKELGLYEYSLKRQINEQAKKELESYIDSLKTQLKVIETAIDEQTKWLEANRDAEVDRLKVHKKQLEEIVKSIVTKLSGQNSDPDGVGNVPPTRHGHGPNSLEK